VKGGVEILSLRSWRKEWAHNTLHYSTDEIQDAMGPYNRGGSKCTLALELPMFNWKIPAGIVPAKQNKLFFFWVGLGGIFQVYWWARSIGIRRTNS